ILVDVGEAEALDRAADESCDVRVPAMVRPKLEPSCHVVRSAALAFGGGDEQVVARDGEGARIPLGGDETQERIELRGFCRLRALLVAEIKNRDSGIAHRDVEQVLVPA